MPLENPLTSEAFRKSSLNNSWIPVSIINFDGSAEEGYAFGPIKLGQTTISVSYVNRKRQVLVPNVKLSRIWPSRRKFVNLKGDNPYTNFQKAFKSKSLTLRDLLVASFSKEYTPSEIIAASGTSVEVPTKLRGIRQGRTRFSAINNELERTLLMAPTPIKLDASCTSVEKLRDIWLPCTGCHLGIKRIERGFKNCTLGRGTLTPKLLIIGEAPGRQEEQFNMVFYPEAPAGSLLTRCLRQAGIVESLYYIDNAVCCRPPADNPVAGKGPENGKPDAEALAACQPRLKALYWFMKPKAVLLLGSFAYTAWYGKPPESMKRLIGWQTDQNPLNVYLSYHPAYLVRKKEKELLNQFLSNLKDILERINNETE